jgi:hypothetical protein
MFALTSSCDPYRESIILPNKTIPELQVEDILDAFAAIISKEAGFDVCQVCHQQEAKGRLNQNCPLNLPVAASRPFKLPIAVILVASRSFT